MLELHFRKFSDKELNNFLESFKKIARATIARKKI